MRPEKSATQAGLAPPAWLRPTALVLIIFIHLAVLVGVPWSAERSIVKAPLEVEVVPAPQPARDLGAIDDRQSSELKISEPVSVDAPVIEAASAVTPNNTDVKPSDVQALDDARPLPAMGEPKDVRAEPQPPATESMPLDVVTAATLAVAPVLEPSKTETSTAPTEVQRQESNPTVVHQDAAAEVVASTAVFEPAQVEPADHAQNGVVMALVDAKAVGALAETLAPGPHAPIRDALAGEGAPIQSAPLDAAQIAAPVTIAPTAFDSQDAETLGSQVSSRRDDTLVTSLQPSGQGDSAATRMQEIISYVRQYDGGDCFFIAPVAVSETGATLEGYGVSTRAFEGLDAGFLHKNGFEASIGVRIVSQAQCPAVSFLARLRQQPAPRLRIDTVSLRAGEPLTGSVDDDEGRSIALLLVSDAGMAENVSAWLEPGMNRRSFTIATSPLGNARGGQPRLLLAVASARPLESLRFQHPIPASRLFSAVSDEAAKTGQKLAAMARYFKLQR